jgi:hypothetical protein
MGTYFHEALGGEGKKRTKMSRRDGILIFCAQCEKKKMGCFFIGTYRMVASIYFIAIRTEIWHEKTKQEEK